MENYILGIDQSTQGTKALLFDDKGNLISRTDLPHRQIIDERGWVEHDPEEILKNTIHVVKDLVKKNGISKEQIRGIGISNQRETAMVWDRESGRPIYNAVVWQCARGEQICRRLEEKGYAEKIRQKTGLRLSPYFSAAKIAWILQNVEGAGEKNEAGKLCIGTMDSWLVYKLTKEHAFKTDYSNASRTQLFNITDLCWDNELCQWFGVNRQCLPKVCGSDELFGMTDLDGYLDHPIPIHGVLGDSHGALFGQGCTEPGMIKVTYGTGSSIMMNIGEKPVLSDEGIVTSLAYKIGEKVNYVLEGNINYTGAVISWLKNDLKLIDSAGETEELAKAANLEDETYLVPAFSGLGAPYWDSDARAVISGMSRTTGKNEMVKAALESIAYQISDIVEIMKRTAGLEIAEIRVDGGPTRNHFLMQFQSDILNIPVRVPDAEELSGIGAAYAAGIAMGIYDQKSLFENVNRTEYKARMNETERERKINGWRQAVEKALTK